MPIPGTMLAVPIADTRIAVAPAAERDAGKPIARRLPTQRLWPTWAILATQIGILLAIIGLGLTVDTIPGLLSVVLGVDTALVLVLLVAHQRQAPALGRDAVSPAVEGFRANEVY